MRRFLRIVLVIATLGLLAYVLAQRSKPSPATAPARPAAPAAPPAPAVPTGGVEPSVTEVGDLDGPGEPELDTAADRSERVSDTDVAPAGPAKVPSPAGKPTSEVAPAPPRKRAPAKKATAKKAAAKKATAKKAAAKKAGAKKAPAKKAAAPPPEPPVG